MTTSRVETDKLHPLSIDDVRAVIERHAESVDAALRQCLRSNPDADVAVVVTEFLDGDATVVVTDKNGVALLVNEYECHIDSELMLTIASEGRRLFEVQPDDGTERALVVDNAKGLVSRARFASTARRDVRRQRLLDVARACVLPPHVNAQNAEVLAMSLAVFMHSLRDNRYPWEDSSLGECPAEIARVIAATKDIFTRLSSGTMIGLAGDDGRVDSRIGFLGRWKDAAFARLEISHKLAAALCLTDVRDSDDVVAPWGAWSLVVPNGLLLNGPARVWCLGKLPVATVDAHGHVRPWAESGCADVMAEMVLSLVLGSCLAMSDPARAHSVGRWGSSNARGAAWRKGGPPPEGSRYVLSHPVSIDLRREVLDAISGGSGRKGGAPKVQFLVRGHWRNQACGPHHSQRKHIWIEPFWKGPEDARILLRSHKVDSGGDEAAP